MSDSQCPKCRGSGFRGSGIPGVIGFRMVPCPLCLAADYAESFITPEPTSPEGAMQRWHLTPSGFVDDEDGFWISYADHEHTITKIRKQNSGTVDGLLEQLNLRDRALAEKGEEIESYRKMALMREQEANTERAAHEETKRELERVSQELEHRKRLQLRELLGECREVISNATLGPISEPCEKIDAFLADPEAEAPTEKLKPRGGDSCCDRTFDSVVDHHEAEIAGYLQKESTFEPYPEAAREAHLLVQRQADEELLRDILDEVGDILEHNGPKCRALYDRICARLRKKETPK